MRSWFSGRSSKHNVYQQSVLSWSLLLVISCVSDRAGHGGWQRWRDNSPRPARGWDVAEQLCEQGAPRNCTGIPAFQWKVWFESRRTWVLWHCPFSLPVPVTLPPGWGPFELLTHGRESATAAFALPSAIFHPGGCPSAAAAEASPCQQVPRVTSAQQTVFSEC